MKKQLLFIILILSGVVSFGQNFQWAKSFGGGSSVEGRKVILDAQDNVYSYGNYRGTTDFDPGLGVYNLTGNADYISKLSASGNFIWAITVPGTINSIVLDSKGNIYVTGQFVGKPDFDPGLGTFLLNSEGNWDVFILKLNSSGKFLIAKRIGGKNNDYGYTIELNKAGNIFTTGSFSGLVDFDPGIPTYKINSSGYFYLNLDSVGNFLSVKTSKQEGWKKMATDNKGNYYTTGFFSGKQDFDLDSSKTYYLSSKGDNDVFVLKHNGSGDLIWGKSFGGVLTDRGNAVAVDSKNNVYITGSFEDSIDLDPGSGFFYLGSNGKTDGFVLKLDSNGSFVWGNCFSGVDKESGNFILVDDSANIYTAGYFEDTVDFDPGSKRYNLVSAGNSDIFYMKLSFSGKLMWAKRIGGTSAEYLNFLTIDKNRNLFSTGLILTTVDFDPDPAKAIIGSNNNDIAFVFKLGPCPSPTEAISGLASLCGGATKGTYSITPSAGANGYKWTVPKGATIDSGQNSAKIKVTFGTTLGDITVRPNNICDTTIKSVLTIKNFPAASVTANAYPSTTLCKGNYVRLYGNGANIYTWNKGVYNNVSFYPDSTDTYIVTGTDNNGCIDKDTITINVNGVATPTSINGPTSVCGGGGKATFSVTPISGAAGYVWTVPNKAIIDSGKNTPTIYVTFSNGSSSGYISVNTANACNSSPISKYISVTTPLISISVIPSSTICKGTPIQLNASGGTNYIWSGGITNGLSFIPDTTTTYTVTETNSTGCAGTNSILIKVNPLPTIGAVATPSAFICKGSSITLNGTGANTYIWDKSVNNNTPFTPSSSGKYKVTGTDINGCRDTASIAIKVTQQPLISSQPINQTISKDTSVIFLASTKSVNANFQWQMYNPSIIKQIYENLSNSSLYSGTKNDTLILTNISSSQNNSKFRCIISEEGCSTITNTAVLTIHAGGVQNIKGGNRYSIYPNPANSFITIESNHTLNKFPYTITDQTGRQILKGDLNSKINAVDVSALASGFYFLQIGETSKETFKILKQ